MTDPTLLDRIRADFIHACTQWNGTMLSETLVARLMEFPSFRELVDAAKDET